MKTRKINEVEIMRHGVTPAQFLAYLRKMQKTHAMSNDFDLEYFKAGNDLNFYYTDGTPDTKPCASERSVSKPYEMQTYVRGCDGSVFNEICEFTFDDEKTGTGYYYTVTIEVDESDREANIAEYLEKVAQRAEKQIERNNSEIAEIREDLNRNGEYMQAWYRESREFKIEQLNMENAELTEKIAECRPDPESIILAPAEAGCVWDEDGNEIDPETVTRISLLLPYQSGSQVFS